MPRVRSGKLPRNAIIVVARTYSCWDSSPQRAILLLSFCVGKPARLAPKFIFMVYVQPALCDGQQGHVLERFTMGTVDR